MKFEIRRAKNGWIVANLDPENTNEVVGLEKEDEHESFATFLREVSHYYGPTDSKHSAKRVRVVILPGSDYYGTLDDSYRKSLDNLREDINYALKAKKWD